MFRSVSRLTHSTVTATDGDIGDVTAAFFDDQSWVIRYLVVDTETWLPAREVLISPYAVKTPLPNLNEDKNIHVSLTLQQVKDSPDIDTHQPVSRQHEREYLSYYAFPAYWEGGDMWGMGGYPLLPPMATSEEAILAAKVIQQRDIRAADVHLRNSKKVIGYDIHAVDGVIGHVEDFIFDEKSWAIRYLVVNTRNWWPGGHKVLVAKHWVDSIDYATNTVRVAITQEEVKNSAAYDESITIDRPYEQALHDYYKRKGYWL